MYRVFGCNGSTSTDIITAAIYMAASDGAHIINLSLGGGPEFSDDSAAAAAEAVGKRGHFVVASAGNDGSAGMFVSGNPANSKGAISVASFDNAYTIYSKALVGEAQYAYSAAKNNGSIVDGQIWDVVINDITAEDKNILDDGCSVSKETPPLRNLSGKALLIRWGNPTLGGSAKRCKHAVSLGAAMCILYGNTPAMVSILGVSEIPGIFLSQEGGLALLRNAQQNATTTTAIRIQFTFQSMHQKVPTAGTLSTFSSPGLSLELQMKPDIAAIGGTVLSSMSPFAISSQKLHGDSGVMSGTSMAAPYLAGVLALLIEARGFNLTFQEAKGYLQNYARPTRIYNGEESDNLISPSPSLIYNPAYQGAGLVDAYGSLSGSTLVLPSSFSLNDSIGLQRQQQEQQGNHEFSIWNHGLDDAVYFLEFVASGTVEPFLEGDDYMQDQNSTRVVSDPSWGVEFLDGSSVHANLNHQNQSSRWGEAFVRVEAGGKAVVKFKVHPPPTTKECRVYGGTIRILNTNAKESAEINVPLVGVAGVWKDRAVWVRDSKSLAERVFQAKLNITSVTVSTGIYADFNLLPVSESGASVLNATEGVVVLALTAMTSRIAMVEMFEFAGGDGGGGGEIFENDNGSSGSSSSSTSSSSSSIIGVLNLVDFDPARGSAPLFGRAAYWEPLQRTAFADAQSVKGATLYLWDGRVWGYTNGTTGARSGFKPPAKLGGGGGYYFVRFKALKPFGNSFVEGDWDEISSPVFKLVF
ncbi:hypothetical protein BDR26DRAFT_853253 [Obelidium mucronatum]|nr:hypothetical protein BDR26DRAFT_853253 [Obelidium mucronatum]